MKLPFWSVKCRSINQWTNRPTQDSTPRWNSISELLCLARHDKSPRHNHSDCLRDRLTNSMQSSPSWKANSSAYFMQHEGSLPSSQKPSTCLYPTPYQSSPRHLTLRYRYNTRFNNTVSSKPRSSQRSLPFRPHYQKSVKISLLSHTCHMSSPSHLPWFDHPHVW